jgi:hypothetical protein
MAAVVLIHAHTTSSLLRTVLTHTTTAAAAAAHTHTAPRVSVRPRAGAAAAGTGRKSKKSGAVRAGGVRVSSMFALDTPEHIEVKGNAFADTEVRRFMRRFTQYWLANRCEK